MIKSNIAKLLISSTGLLVLSGCGLASMPKGYSPIEKQTVQELSPSNYTPRSENERAAILTQDLFAQATFWSREYDLNPADLEAAINLSSTLRQLGNPHQSIEVAQTTRALYPRDVDLMAELSAAFIAVNNPKDALPVIDMALGQRPNMARLWSLKGAALDQFEQYPEARQHYSKGLALSPNNPGIIANVGLSYALEGDPQIAEIWLRRAANLPGASASTRQNLSLVLALQNKFDEAEKWARRDLDQQTASNNMSYIRTLRGSSVPTMTTQQPTTGQQPTTAQQQAGSQTYRDVRPVPKANTITPYGQTIAAGYQRPQPIQRPQAVPQLQPQQGKQAYGNPYLRPAKIPAPATRLTNYGQVDTAKSGVANITSARDAALAAARQVRTNPYSNASPYANVSPYPNVSSGPNVNSGAQTISQAPQKIAPQNVLGKISQNNMPKAEIALRQQQEFARRAQAQQRAQQQAQPYPGAIYPQTPQTAQEQAGSQPVRQRRW